MIKLTMFTSYTLLITNKYIIPIRYILVSAIKLINNVLNVSDLIFNFNNNLAIIGTNIKLNINPNDGVNIFDMPPEKLENTGIPKRPMTIYDIIIISESIKGKISASSKTTSTCNVNDISDKGIDIYELTINSARNILSIAIRLIVISYPKILRSKPAATADPITPATLGPIACINR